MAEGIIFKFWMWPPLSGGNLHCKFGAIWIRNHGATDAWKSWLCCSCQYILTLFARVLFSWATRHTTVCLDYSSLLFELLSNHNAVVPLNLVIKYLNFFDYLNCWNDCSIRVFCLKCGFYKNILNRMLYMNEWALIIQTFIRLSEHTQSPTS